LVEREEHNSSVTNSRSDLDQAVGLYFQLKVRAIRQRSGILDLHAARRHGIWNPKIECRGT
jgi:hypothetical protein